MTQPLRGGSEKFMNVMHDADDLLDFGTVGAEKKFLIPEKQQSIGIMPHYVCHDPLHSLCLFFVFLQFDFD